MSSISPIDSGGLILSYKCNCRCRHCLYAGGPDWRDPMDVCDAARIFRGLLDTSSHLRGFHLAGGEPFLDFGRLLRIQRLATEFGIPIEYVETNAGWCVDDDTTRERLETLRDAGLGCMLVSCSPFHAERVPVSRVTTAVRIGYEVFGSGGVILWVPEFYRQLSRISPDSTISLDQYVEFVGLDTARYMIRTGYSLISGGRVGYGLAPYYEHCPPEFCESDTCRMEILESGHAHFDPYGNLIPAFCSGISLGDARELRKTIGEFDPDRMPLVRTLIEQGPYGLYRFAAREFGYEAPREGYIGKCHLCVDVRRWIHARTDQFAELAPSDFYHQLGG